jgi:hypothetical protein
MNLYGFRVIETSDFETKAGRDSIMTFVLKKDLPAYRDNIGQYKDLHTGFYGSSSMLHFDTISKEVLKVDPSSMLDYGCGRSDLVAHFWNDGKRRIARYDPAVPAYKDFPKEGFEMVLCNDVLEHIEMMDVVRVLEEIKSKSINVVFTISMKLARAKLPDGRNAHITLLSRSEWLRWLKQHFQTVVELPSQWEHILCVKTFGDNI